MTPSRGAIAPALPVALYGACIVIIIAGLRAAAPILTPLALAAFVAAVSHPVLRWLHRRHVPTGLAIPLVVLFDASILAFFGWIVLRTVAELRLELPAYVARVQVLETAVRSRLLEWGLAIPPDYLASLFAPQRLFDLAAQVARNVTGWLTLLFLVLLYLVFILAESVGLRDRLQHVLGTSAAGLEGATDALGQVQRYLGLKTLISLATGASVGTGAALLGVDFALFWGLLAFVLNFIPSVGSIIAAIPAILVALLQLGPGTAAALAAIYLLVNVTLGSFLDPILVGRHLRLSPIIILVSLLFWGWTWGLVGMFLAVPLTIALRIVMEHSPQLQPFAALMGPVPTPGAPGGLFTSAEHRAAAHRTTRAPAATPRDSEPQPDGSA